VAGLSLQSSTVLLRYEKTEKIPDILAAKIFCNSVGWENWCDGDDTSGSFND